MTGVFASGLVVVVGGCDGCDGCGRIFVDEVGRFNAALREHHWLGYRLTGQVLRYVALLGGEWVAVLGFGSAVLSCRARDEFRSWGGRVSSGTRG